VNDLGSSLRRTLLVVAVLVLTLVAGATSSASAATSYSGTLTDGATWIAQVPDDWNGILVLYSHGFGPLLAANAPDDATRAALLDRGYAVAGSSYDPNGSWWALESAAGDQFETIGAFTAEVGEKPERVLAFGSSMGGLVSALMAEQGAGKIDGALSTCGIVAGGIALNNYQLDGEYVMTKLLAPMPVQLVDFFPDFGAAIATGFTLQAVATQAQATPDGRARLARARARRNATPAPPGQPTPPANEPHALEEAQVASMFGGGFPIIAFVNAARPWIEMSAGGNASWTRGEDFSSLLDHSPYANNVRALYRQAGLDLKGDLARLTADADTSADPTAIERLQQTSVPTGRLQVPELDLHTVHDPLVPVEMENQYAAVVRRAGANSLLRQAFVDRFGHCSFTPAEYVAGIGALRHRVESGRWDSVAQPQALQASAGTLGLGDAAFVHFEPPALSGDNGSFDPARNGR
jgi:pimeloyl-ACP methyl ester carboxylesterase